ncbi:hypothetical protein F5144DRAFT_64775 [Chaetomium tenue]|uniref:Uncharacterized protein n=1 Tax=Chaetomium tenue TaxID=1854479 RepID=A0ACB7PTG3_9PEZI|nr:hypothetical protein F5144DRAFT_64775 [Chaetomium globosum]
MGSVKLMFRPRCTTKAHFHVTPPASTVHMSAPPTPGLRPRPLGDLEQGYSEDQENWSDDPSNRQDEPETPRRKPRRHVLPSRLGQSSFMPGGQTVPYGHLSPRQEYSEPFAPGPRLRPYYTPDQWYSSPPGSFSQDSGHYSAGQYGTSYIPAPHPESNPFLQSPYHPSMPAGQPPFGYTPPYQPPAPQQLSPSFPDRPTSIRLPSIRVKESQQKDAERGREADEQHWRERSRQRERERKEAEKAEKAEKAKKKERERERERESSRLQREKLELKVKGLQQQLRLEKSKRSDPVGVEATLQGLVNQVRDLREQENQRRWTETRLDPVAQLLQGLADLADTRRAGSYQQDRLSWPGGFSPRPRLPTRGDLSDVSYDTVQRSRIEEVVIDVLGRLTASGEQEKDRLPLPAASQPTTRGARENSHTDDRPPRGLPPEWQDEEFSAASPRPRFGDAPGDFDGDAYRGPSPPRHRFGATPGAAPSAPKPGRRQATAPANIEVAMSGSNKRAHESDLSSEYTSAADRGSHPAPESRGALPRRTREPRRSESHRSPGARKGPQSTGSRGHAVSLENQDPAGDPSAVGDIGEYGFSGSDTEDGARGPRQARPYRFAGEKVQGSRYNPRDARAPTPPPEVPDAPMDELGGGRAWRAAGGRERGPRRVARVDSWSDDGDEP